MKGQPMTVENALIALSDETEQHQHFAPGTEFWQQNAYTFVGASSGMDFMLFTKVCVVAGREGGQWPHVGERVEHTTELIMLPSDRRGSMADHHFIASGIHPHQLREKSELSVTESADAVRWSIEGRVYEATSGNWHVRGEHGGVDLDLIFTPILPPLWPWGRTDDPTLKPIWYDTMCAVSGTITVAGKTYPIDGTGIREHMTVGPHINNIANNAPRDPIYWDYLVSPDISVWFFRYPGPGQDLAFVRLDGEDIPYTSGQITHTVIEHWADRRSGLSFPCKWNLVLASPRGTLVLDIAAHGRSFLPWVMTPGIRLEIWMLGTGNGVFHRPDGTRTLIEDQLMVINPLQFLTYAEENLDGTMPQLPHAPAAAATN
jgi:hypothetical protein